MNKYGLGSIVMLLGAYGIALVIFSQQTTIDKSDFWTATKPNLEKGVVGAVAFATTRTVFAHQNMDLGVWHGFQEVLVKTPVHPLQVSYDFDVSKTGYLIFVLGYTDKGFYGLRLSRGGWYKSMFFSANLSGEFLTTQEISPPIHEGNNHVHLELKQDRLVAQINKEIFNLALKSEDAYGQVGFRGSISADTVGNFSMQAQEGNFSDNFSLFKGALKYFPYIFLLLYLIYLAIHFSAGIASSAAQALRLPYLILITVFTFASYAFVIADYILVRPAHPVKSTLIDTLFRSYPNDKYKNTIEDESLLERRFLANIANFKKDHLNVVIMGSSQTWGAGARLASDTIGAVTCEKLAKLSKKPIHCANSAISGHRVAMQSALLEKMESFTKQMQLADIFILNMSQNDRGNPSFKDDVYRLVQHIKKMGKKMILLKEANAVSEPSNTPMLEHVLLDLIGGEFGVPVFDPHTLIAEHRNQGILWWDYVHMTSYGQKVVGDALADWIFQNIDTNRRTKK